MTTIRYLQDVQYGNMFANATIKKGAVVSAEIQPNGNAWWFRDDRRQFLVYPHEYELVTPPADTLVVVPPAV